jgi:2-polyprenyl-3-methyl-5-hydroxy-6-metoxy-1,4-benzoquinol methylase
MTKKQLHESIRRLAWRLIFPVPRHLLENQKRIDSAGLDAIKKSIKKNYHTGWRNPKHYSNQAYKQDLADHLISRLENDRRIVVPWLDSVRSLRNKHILEIGCGTGSSTVALAEQGAKVTGIDTDEAALLVAKDRCKVYGLNVRFGALNATALSEHFPPNAFESVIFFACLEHMTVAERITALKNVWEILPRGGLLVVLETPNRLWYFDDHTSMLPLFHWLPNELAFRYSSFSPKENFNELYLAYDSKSKEHFLRRGRGVSFHEFELAIKPARDLNIVSSLSSYNRLRKKFTSNRQTKKYESFLAKLCPNIHEGFFQPYLYLIMEKP